MKSYYKEYELLVDLPTGEKKGSHFFFHVSNDNDTKIWYQVGKLSEYSTQENKWYSDWESKGIKLSIEQMTSNFFKPIGEPKPLYPKFPNKEEIKEFYSLVGESRLVNSVDEVRAINQVFYSEEYYNACYDILKKMYEDKFFNS